MNLVGGDGKPMNQKQAPPGPKMDASQLIDVKCDSCEAQLFEPLFYMKKVPKMLTQNGRDTFVPIQTWRCAGCGEINDEFKINNLL